MFLSLNPKGKHGCKEFYQLNLRFKDLEKFKYFLGMEVAQSREGMVVSQRKYMLDLLSEVIGGKSTDVPIDFNHKTGMTTKEKKVDKKNYQKLVGRLVMIIRS